MNHKVVLLLLTFGMLFLAYKFDKLQRLVKKIQQDITKPQKFLLPPLPQKKLYDTPLPISQFNTQDSDTFSVNTDALKNSKSINIQRLSEESSEISYDSDDNNEVTKIITTQNDKSDDNIYEAIESDVSDVSDVSHEENNLHDKKLEELLEIAEKLEIVTFKEINGKKKKKTKKELITEIMEKEKK